MKNGLHQISFEQARKIAEDAARLNLSNFLMDSSIELLSNRHLEAEYCWMFFRNPKITIPPESALRGEWAYAVSKYGQVRDVGDLSGEPEKLKLYVEKMSEYFKRLEPNAD